MGSDLKSSSLWYGKSILANSVPYAMENHFYHIRLPPLNVTICITHVRNGSYATAYDCASVPIYQARNTVDFARLTSYYRVVVGLGLNES